MGKLAVTLSLAVFTGCVSAPPLPEELTSFRFEGKPIHPAIINEFIPWLSDGEPVVAAVDLEGFTRSRNRLSGWTVKEEKGGVDGDREGNGGFLSYQHLGRDEVGNHYLEIYDNGGGSATWHYLMELRFEVVEAYGARRLLLRCVNVEGLGCCAFGKVDKKLVPEPCGQHPRPIPDVEPPNVEKSIPALADPELLGTWDSCVVQQNLSLGSIRVFPHSLFVERQGSVPFTLIASAEGQCLLHLSVEVDSSRYLILDARSSLTPRPPALRMSFLRTLEDGRKAFSNETQEGSDWNLVDRAGN